MVDGFVAAANFIAKVIGFLGAVGKWAITLLAIAASLFVGFAVVLFLTARGLNAGEGWARVVGILVVILPLLVSFIVLASRRRSAIFGLAGVTFAASAYVIWALGWHFV